MIFFDIGATLIQGPKMGPARQCAERFGFDLATRKRLDQLLLTQKIESEEAFCAVLRQDFSLKNAKGLEEAVAAIWESQKVGVETIPGAVTLLKTLKAQNIPFGFISNIWHPYAESFESLFPEAVHCQKRYYSYQLGAAKPDPAFYRQILAQEGLSAPDCLMVGDTYVNDIAPAQALGMKTLWLVHRPHKEEEALAKTATGSWPMPTARCDHIRDVTPGFLEAILSGQITSEENGLVTAKAF